MIIGKVEGTIVSTRKSESLVGYKLLLVSPYYGDKKEIFVAADNLGAGIGELVMVARGSSTQYALTKSAPIDALVVGIVDARPQI